MNNMSTADIREQFLSYFESQKNLPHKRVTSSSLIPGNDKTLMFTNAGMVQFKDVFLGQDKRDYERATTVQRCVRAGGKHNDLENVGHTARHHTFFEMMGNFSFGNYFKQEAIQFAWTFLTEVIGLPKEKLWITVFEEDDEAERIWLEGIGVDKNRLSRIGAKDNFWQMGDTGPCGPCTEIFYDHGEAIWGGPPGTPEEDGDRYIEIWNLVFMQYNRSADGVLHPLPKPSVDTGMGLERLAAILQGVHSNYETDIFQYLMRHLCELAASDDMNHDSLKVVADHIRSCAFMIADGVIPSNEGRGYVLRRIIRRALRHGHQLGLTDPFFHKMVQPLVDMMGEAYPELSESAERISEILLKEEQRFAVTLEQGLAILQQAMDDLKGDTLDGEVVFKLYDTYGFPKDLTADIARDNRLKIDEQGFDEHMEAQRQKARDAGSFATNYNDAIQIDDATVFTGYEHTQDTAKINHVFVDGVAQTRLDTGDTAIVVLDKTPFYAESGGQVGDSGEIRSANGAVFKVQDTQKQGQAFIHIGSLQSGQLSVADEVSAEVDAERRQAIVTNHSATHLLHKVLRDTLGTHVEQKGSLVDADKLRFDFSHHEGLSAEQCQVIEQQVNQRIRANRSADVDVMDMDAAKSKGAMALFGEKYDDDVRVITLGDSMELCGGTHVSSTGDIGYFRISNESGIAAGVRRIEANTSDAAVMQSFNNQQRIQQFAKQLKATPEQLDEKLQQLLVQNRDYEKQLSKLKAKSAMMAGNDLSAQAVEVNGIQVLTAVLEEVDAKSLRDSLDQLKNKLQKAAILLASVQGDKVVLIAGVTKAESTQYPAGEMLAHVAQQIDGKGGGRPDMAQGGGVNSPKLKPAVDSVVNWIKERG